MHEPIYPLTAGLTNTTLRKAIGEALARLPAFPEWMDEGYRAKNAWPSFADALRRLHAPEGEADVAPSAPARARLAHDELLANQLALAVIRARLKRRAGRKLAAPGKLRKAIVSALPFG
jgi:ATP-dependent DNA helicase RecG